MADYTNCELHGLQGFETLSNLLYTAYISTCHGLLLLLTEPMHGSASASFQRFSLTVNQLRTQFLAFRCMVHKLA